jgi:hypothetical protein
MPDIDRLIEAWKIFRDSNPYEICNGREFRAISEPEYCMGQMIEDTIALLRERGTKWINVNEKLPDENGKYLVNYVAFNFQSMKVMQFAKDLHSVDDYNFRNEHRPGWDEFDDETGYFERTNVTHWMPLPNAPQDDLNIV